MTGFHVSDGLFFEREDDGSVLITKTKDGTERSPIVFAHKIDASVWCSVISSMSKGGEHDGRFRNYRLEGTQPKMREGLP